MVHITRRQALKERQFATLETELINYQPRRRFSILTEANREVQAILKAFYNSLRIHSALDYRVLVASERNHVIEHCSNAISDISGLKAEATSQ